MTRRRAAAALVVAVALAAAGVAVAWWREREALAAQAAAARALFEPAVFALETDVHAFDLDPTVRVMHHLDGAAEVSASFREYLGRAAAARYDDVAPNVLLSRAKVLRTLELFYAQLLDPKDQEAAWGLSRELLLGGLPVVHEGTAGASM